MDKETLSNYGWIVICVLVLAVMIALATPFGNFIAEGFKATYAGFSAVGDKALGIIVPGSNIGGSENDTPEDGDSNGGVPENPDTEGEETEPTECEHKNTTTVNESATYTGDTYCNDCNTTIATGETIVNLNPDNGTTPTDGDVYTAGDYIYTYQTSSNGWSVSVIDANKTTYGAILESINGEPVTSMYYTFKDCTSLTTAPEIPAGVTDMTATFLGCTSLTTASKIPVGVTNMSSTFKKCTSLTTAPEIPDSVTDIRGIFSGCTSLTTAPKIPSGVTIMSGAFTNCTNLKTYTGSTDKDGDFSGYIIPNRVDNLQYTFQNCTALTTAPVIPSSVTQMQSTFSGCTSLTTAPVIPSSVKYMQHIFKNCTSLAGTITINSNPYSWTQALYNTQITAITGSTTTAANIMLTKTSTEEDPTA